MYLPLGAPTNLCHGMRIGQVPSSRSPDAIRASQGLLRAVPLRLWISVTRCCRVLSPSVIRLNHTTYMVIFQNRPQIIQDLSFIEINLPFFGVPYFRKPQFLLIDTSMISYHYYPQPHHNIVRMIDYINTIVIMILALSTTIMANICNHHQDSPQHNLYLSSNESRHLVAKRGATIGSSSGAKAWKMPLHLGRHLELLHLGAPTITIRIHSHD